MGLDMKECTRFYERELYGSDLERKTLDNLEILSFLASALEFMHKNRLDEIERQDFGYITGRKLSNEEREFIVNYQAEGLSKPYDDLILGIRTCHEWDKIPYIPSLNPKLN